MRVFYQRLGATQPNRLVRFNITDPNRIAPDEITVRDGHLSIRLGQLADGWYAVVESDIEGKIFEGRVTELSELLAGQPVQAHEDEQGGAKAD